MARQLCEITTILSIALLPFLQFLQINVHKVNDGQEQ